MITETIPLLADTPGVRHSLAVQRFGAPGARPKVYVQAGLHADEIPGMLAIHHLREKLLAAEAANMVPGEVVLVPVANPLGLAQRVLGQAVGRFHLADGLNFNRGYPYFTQRVADRVEKHLTGDAARNAALIREALQTEAAALHATTLAQSLKVTLVRLALDADVVLDLHCDTEAVVHLYTLPSLAAAFDPLARLLGATSVLLADESGDDPFDEVFSRPWHELRERYADKPIPNGCISTTVELRGELDVTDALGRADADALFAYFQHIGAVAGRSGALPDALYRATELRSVEPLVAPQAGILVFSAEAGSKLGPGDPVADIVDPYSGNVTTVCCRFGGVLFARNGGRFVAAGQKIGKIAGTTLQREGLLLTP